MPAKTKKQKRFFGAVMGAKKGQKGVSGKAKKVAKEMPKKEIEKFLKTEEDEQSVMKKMKMGGGKAIFDGPEVKQRKHFAPATKPYKPKKGKGSYDRKNNYADESEEIGNKMVKESNSIIKFIEALITNNHADAHKHLKDVVNVKIQAKIEQEIEKPLF